MLDKDGKIRPWHAAHSLELAFLVSIVDTEPIHPPTSLSVWPTGPGTYFAPSSQHELSHGRPTNRSSGPEKGRLVLMYLSSG